MKKPAEQMSGGFFHIQLLSEIFKKKLTYLGSICLACGLLHHCTNKCARCR
jgi:hypothetical protein